MTKNGAIEVTVFLSFFLICLNYSANVFLNDSFISKLLLQVDEYSRTSVPSIWAVGDVTDRINLTPVALMEGGALAKTIFAHEPTKPDYRCLSSSSKNSSDDLKF